jgi:hypothetical protein
MSPVPVPETSESVATSVYDHRVLFLSGTWERPGDEFRLRATIIVGRNGSADGSIYWRAIRVHGQEVHFFATEWVYGFIKGRDVGLRGYAAEPGLFRDSYGITLSGDSETGTFSGITLTGAYDWSGRIEGRYLFRNRTA